MAVTITATKAGRRGKPAVEIAFDPGTKLDEILAAQSGSSPTRNSQRLSGSSSAKAATRDLILTSSRSTKTSFRGESAIASGPKLGVGLLFNPTLPGFVGTHSESFDYLEIIPDREWFDRGRNSTSRYSVLGKSLDFFRRVRESKPLLCHAIGLSIGSARLFDTGHVEQIRGHAARVFFRLAQRSPLFLAGSSGRPRAAYCNLPACAIR